MPIANVIRPAAPLLGALLFAALLLGGCERRDSQTPTEPPATASEQSATPAAPEAEPPRPPLFESFDGEPQLSLFPRVGGFRPEDDDKEGLGYWLTFIEHLTRTSGAAGGAGRDASRGWMMRGNTGLDSLGFFSPLAVEPDSRYRVSFTLQGDLPEGGVAGIGVLEFDEFLWIAEQFPESLHREHQTGSHRGVELTGQQAWEEHDFSFTTGPDTRMIHLVLYRDGTQDRKPVVFDDIRVAPAEASAAAPTRPQ